MPFCPACRREWPDEREACPDCLASLVDDLDATVVCRHCAAVCPARMQSCPNCLGELRLDPTRVADAMVSALASGRRLPRPPGSLPFARGLNCSLLRTAARASLIYCGPDDLMEATVEGDDHRAITPLRCVDFDGSVLFRLERYEAAEDATVALSADGAPLGTYLRADLPRTGLAGAFAVGLQVRDETSAPAATLRPTRRPDDDFELAETGGNVLATCARVDAELDGWIDDQWSLRVEAELPLRPLAAVALLLAAKVLLGRPSPTPVSEQPSLGEEDALGWPYNR